MLIAGGGAVKGNILNTLSHQRARELKTNNHRNEWNPFSKLFALLCVALATLQKAFSFVASKLNAQTVNWVGVLLCLRLQIRMAKASILIQIIGFKCYRISVLLFTLKLLSSSTEDHHRWNHHFAQTLLEINGKSCANETAMLCRTDSKRNE